MNNIKLKQIIIDVLKADERLWNEDKTELNQTLLLDLVENIDEKLIELLLQEKELRDKFFVKIKDVYVFKTNDFRFFIEENKVDNSYTQYKNRIGLTDGKRFLKDTNDVVLNWPYKDCVLEGGQSTEEGLDTYFEYDDKTQHYEEKQAKRKEIFFNSVLAHDEIDRLFDHKALTNWKRFTKDGEQEVGEIKRDEDGTIRENLIIKGNNLLALHSLKKQFAGKVKLIYIDPPYNTGSDGFLYRDNYQHSSWLAMMSDRLEQGTLMMTGDSAIFASIGNDESSHLRLLMVGTLGKNNFRSTVIYRRGIKSVQAQFDTVDKLNQGYDFLLMASKNEGTRFSKLMVPKSLEDEDENEKAEPQGSWNNHCRGTDRPSMRYPLFGITPSSGQWRWGRERSEKAIENYKRMCLELGTDNPSQAQIDEWIRKKDEAGEYLDLLRLSANGTPEHYVRPSSVKLSSDLWTDLKPNGSHQVGSLFGTKVFENPKSTNLVERVIRFVGNDDSMVLDYFAGSGTTGHAVINLNREDGGRRKFILVEMADYFDTVLLPRLKKVTFSPEWKEGKPKRVATAEEAERGPRIIKIIRLESYEDALNNLLPSEESGGQVAMQFEDYLLKYMLQWETRKSETLLNVEKLSKPFDYCLHIYRDGETRVQKVDLPETFNYLIGLDVAKRQLLDDNGRYYLVYRGVTRDGKSTVVIWRETAGWTEEDYKRDRDFVAKHKFTEGADVIYVNGDSLIPGAQALEGVFKAKMFAGVEG